MLSHPVSSGLRVPRAYVLVRRVMGEQLGRAAVVDILNRY